MILGLNPLGVLPLSTGPDAIPPTPADVFEATISSLVRILSDADLPESVVYSLVRVSGTPNVAEASLYSLCDVLTPSELLEADLYSLVYQAPCVTKRCQIFTITRSDGEILRFTTLDHDLIRGGETYTACGGFSPSASEGSNELGDVGSVDLSGPLSLTGISARELDAGLYNGARVEAWLVPWNEGSSDTPNLIVRGNFGKVERTPSGFTVELTGDGAKLQQVALTSPFEPGCRWKESIKDVRCGVDWESISVTGTVDSGLGARSFVDAARTEIAGWFEFGWCTFTSGDNAGITVEVRGHADGGVFTLWQGLANTIMAGDTYLMTPGCDQTAATCKAKFNNYLNYGGFRDVPGEDALKETPDAH